MAKLYPLFSGSKGNCYYIGSGDSGVLVDIGMNAKQTEIVLKNNDIPIENIKGIFITHEHTDHINGLRVFASRYGIDVYGSMGTINELIKKELITDKFNAHIASYEGVNLCDMFILPFKTSHDCSESNGFVVTTADNRTCAVVTDTGTITTDTKQAILGCDTLVIESNHDVNMLLNGMYPYPLKKRITSDIGHLSNEDCADFLPNAVYSGTKRLVLAHLSQENNMPYLAEQYALSALHEKNMKIDNDYKLMIAPVINNGEVVIY